MTRTRYGKAIGVAALGGLLVLSGTALAHGGGSPEERAARIERRVKEKLAPKLGLDEATAAKLADVFRRTARLRHEAMQRVRTERKALKALVERRATSQEIDVQLDRLAAAAAQMPPKRAMFEQARTVLTAEQAAKLVLLRGERRYGRHGGR